MLIILSYSYIVLSTIWQIYGLFKLPLGIWDSVLGVIEVFIFFGLWHRRIWAWWLAMSYSVGGLSAFAMFKFVVTKWINDLPELASTVDLELLRNIAISNVIAGGILFVCLLREKNYFGE